MERRWQGERAVDYLRRCLVHGVEASDGPHALGRVEGASTHEARSAPRLASLTKWIHPVRISTREPQTGHDLLSHPLTHVLQIITALHFGW